MNKIVFAQMAARLESGAGEQKKTGMLAFSRIMEAEEKVGVATISGYIGYGNATVDEFTKHLEELKAEGCTKFEVILNSMGGNLFEASGIYDIIKGCGMEVTAKIYGVAASAATLYAGLAGGADVILLPEIPYDIKKVAQAVEARAKSKKPFSIIAVAEGAMSEEEAKMKKKEREAYRATLPYDCISKRIAAQLSEMVGVEARHVVPGHIQRGGSPSAYDRVLSTQFGVHAAQLIRDEIYGVTVALDGNEIIHNKLKDIAGVPKPVPKDDHVLTTARNMGICMGD